MFNILISVIIVILGAVGLTVLDGFVLTKLWSWFIVPIFHLNPLTLIQALGFSLVIRYLTKDILSKDFSKFDSTEESWIKLIVLIIRPLLFLLLGFIIVSLM